MGRLVRKDTPSRSRSRVLQTLSLALRRGADPSLDDAEQRDLLAFVLLMLEEVTRSVEETVEAWERRDYWLKADRFRREWGWAARLGSQLEAALREGDLASASGAAVQVARHLNGVKAPSRLSNSSPWTGAWKRWQALQGRA